MEQSHKGGSSSAALAVFITVRFEKLRSHICHGKWEQIALVKMGNSFVAVNQTLSKDQQSLALVLISFHEFLLQRWAGYSSRVNPAKAQQDVIRGELSLSTTNLPFERIFGEQII